MQALASSWQGVYDLTLDLLDWTAGAVKDAISDAVGLLTRAEELVDLIHTIKVRWDDLMKLGKDVVDMARNIANAATSGWNIKDLYIFQKSPLDTFQHGH